MNKVRITADAILTIICKIFEDEDVNFIIDDPEAPEEWQGKSVLEVLNVEYYTLKHRPISVQNTVNTILEEKGQTDKLAALSSAFGLLSLSGIERLFTKDNDMAVVEATLEYYIQASKVKLLEYLIEKTNIATCGQRIPVYFGEEERRAVIFFDRPIVSDVISSTPFGEICLVDINVTVALHLDVVTYSEYAVEICIPSRNPEKFISVPLSSFSAANVMTQDAVPSMKVRQSTGNVNLSRGKSFVLIFDGYDNEFINYIADLSLLSDNEDNNIPFYLRITRNGRSYTHTVVIKDHQISVNADTNNETHTLTFVKRGLIDGIA